MTNKLTGKTAIVTGGNSGIGESTAHLFAQHGANVIIMARREEQGIHVQESINSQGGKSDSYTHLRAHETPEQIV